MRIKAYAKINLCLVVLGKDTAAKSARANFSSAGNSYTATGRVKSGHEKNGGYHLIRTVLQQIGLHDTITIKETDGQTIAIACDNPMVPTGRRNSVYKAAELMMRVAAGQKAASAGRKKTALNKPGLHINIQKRIPVASGLGGASSDAAAVINALNIMWKLKLSSTKLRALAAKIGMDTPFFITGGTALGTHYGEKITPLAPIKLPPFLIALNGKKKSTAEMYGLLNLKKVGKKNGPKGAADFLKDYLIRSPGDLARGSGDIAANTGSSTNAARPGTQANATVSGFFHNDFETILAHRQMASTKQLFGILLRSGAVAVHICGSGPAICSFYKNKADLEKAHMGLKGKVKFLWKSGRQ